MWDTNVQSALDTKKKEIMCKVTYSTPCLSPLNLAFIPCFMF